MLTLGVRTAQEKINKLEIKDSISFYELRTEYGLFPYFSLLHQYNKMLAGQTVTKVVAHIVCLPLRDIRTHTLDRMSPGTCN